MAELTREQLIEKLERRLAVTTHYPDVEEAQLDAQIFKIALAALEAEAVAYIIQDSQARGLGRPGFLSFDSSSISDEDINEYEISITPLYRLPLLEGFK